jgi:purine-binding chemotaxis protein CheW
MADHEQFQTLLAFEIAETHCGVPSEFVREVQRAVSLSPVPEAGPHVLGAMNLRGKMVLVLDLRAVIGAASKAIVPTDHFVVILCGDRLLAIRVDRARELLRVEEGAITDSTEVLPTTRFIARVARVGDNFIHIIDPARLCALVNAAKPL